MHVWQKALSFAAAAPNIPQLFGPSLSPGATIHLPSEANYTEVVTQRWSTYGAPSYIAAIQPATVGDVQNIVRIAAAHNISFLATGGGHGVSTQMFALQDGLQIDLSRFDGVRFDNRTGLLTIGGAVRFSQVIDPLYDLGYQFPLGTAYCVGVVGATLGAGVTANQGNLGLLADLLEEVQVVTATGDLVTASRIENPNLFWALGGAGANFGIVTSATYRVPRAPNNGNVINANFLFPPDRALGVYEYLASLDEMPEELALNIGTFYDIKRGELGLLVNANFAGSPQAAAPLFAPLEDLGPIRSEVLVVPWPEIFRTSYFGIKDKKACGRNQHVNMRSIGSKHADPEVIVAFLGQLKQFSKEHPDVKTAMMIHRFPAPKILGNAEGSYPHRDLKMHIQIESEYDDREEDSAVDAFLDSARQNFTRASGYEEPVVYVNFAHGDEGPAAWYGARNLERLTQLKEKWDPRGLFSFYNALPLKRVGSGGNEKTKGIEL